MPTLEQRVAALEQQLQQLGHDESTQERLLTVDSTGHVSAEFTGIVSAQGLTLPTGILTTTPASEIDWTTDGHPDPTKVETQGTIRVFEDISSNPEMDVFVTSPASGFKLFLRLASFIGGHESAEVDINTKPNDGDNTGIFLDASVPSLSLNAIATLLTASDKSSFVQAATPTLAKWVLGDFAMWWYSGGGVAYGPGNGFPFDNTGVSAVAFDPGGRRSGTTYVCRNTGVYVFYGQVRFTSANAGNMTITLSDITNPFTIGKSVYNPGNGLLSFGADILTLMPCTAGDVIKMGLDTGVAITLFGTDPIAGNVAQTFFGGQIS